MLLIRSLAEREAAAEAARGKADQEWRRAWWATTLALGAITDQTELREARRIVASATGSGTSWVSSRTRAGRAFARIAEPETLPPRMAVEVSRAGVDVTEELAERVRQAERDGVSLRAFSKQLTGSGWSDTAEGASPTTIAEIVQAQPEVVAAAIMKDPGARRTLRRALEEDDLAQHGILHGRPIEAFPGDLSAEAIRIVGRIRGVAYDVERLRKRAERDQWPDLEKRLDGAVTGLLRTLAGADVEQEVSS